MMSLEVVRKGCAKRDILIQPSAMPLIMNLKDAGKPKRIFQGAVTKCNEILKKYASISIVFSMPATDSYMSILIIDFVTALYIIFHYFEKNAKEKNICHKIM